MLRKQLFTAAALALALVFTSCSFLTESKDSGRVTITLNQATIQKLQTSARAAGDPADESNYSETLYIDIQLKGDYEDSQTITSKENESATVTFEKLRRGSKVYLQADAYIEEPGMNEKIMLFTGSSDTIEIKTGENPVSLQLKRIYEVWFDANGGTTEYEPQRIVSGGKITKPADPKKESEGRTAYEFAGWFTSADGGITLSEKPFDFNTPVKEYIVLYAKWISKKMFLVSFNANGGTAEIEDQLIVEGKNASEPETPEREAEGRTAYEFAGWYTSTDNGITLSEKPFNFESQITSDITLYAKWKSIQRFAVTFDNNGGIGNVEEQLVVEGMTANAPEKSPEKEADENYIYNFAGWYTSINCTDDSKFNFDTPIKADVTLYAGWTKKPIYTVHFDTDGGNEIEDQRVITGNTAEKPEDPKKDATELEGYIFDGWYTADNKPYDFSTPITGNLTLKANWKVSVVAGVEVKIPFDEVSDINVSETKNEANNTWTYTAATGYDTYKWKWDGEVQTSVTSNTFTTPLNTAPGSYTISLQATKVVDGETKYYSYTTQLVIE